jgi:asparagine synthase (glutamine-hydrolysing)
LPTRFKFCRGQRKVLLKKALAGALPPEILNRPKKGFGIPAAAWLRQGLVLPSADLPTGFNEAVAARRLLQHQSGEADHRLFLWAYLALAQKLVQSKTDAVAAA